jgi:hypothetical protein
MSLVEFIHGQLPAHLIARLEKAITPINIVEACIQFANYSNIDDLLNDAPDIKPLYELAQQGYVEIYSFAKVSGSELSENMKYGLFPSKDRKSHFVLALAGGLVDSNFIRDIHTQLEINIVESTIHHIPAVKKEIENKLYIAIKY